MEVCVRVLVSVKYAHTYEHERKNVRTCVCARVPSECVLACFVSSSPLTCCDSSQVNARTTGTENFTLDWGVSIFPLSRTPSVAHWSSGCRYDVDITYDITHPQSSLGLWGGGKKSFVKVERSSCPLLLKQSVASSASRPFIAQALIQGGMIMTTVKARESESERESQRTHTTSKKKPNLPQGS